MVDSPVSSMKTRRAGSEIGLVVKPGLSAFQDVGTVLLQCMCGLFLKVQSWRPSQALRALRLIRTDRSPFSRPTISFSVMSLRSSISPTMKVACAFRADARRLPCGQFTNPGPRDPSDRTRYPNPEPRGSLPRRHSSRRCLQNPRPQIVAQRSGHHQPPLKQMLNHQQRQTSHHNRFINRRMCSSDPIAPPVSGRSSEGSRRCCWSRSGTFSTNSFRIRLY